MSVIKKLFQIIAVLILPVTIGVAALSSAPAFAGNHNCGGVQTSFNFNCQNADAKSGDLNKNPVFSVLLFILNLLGIGVGVAAVGFIVWGSIVYMSAGGSSDQVKQGINYIRNAIIGLLLYMAMFAAANWLIPGGIFSQ